MNPDRTASALRLVHGISGKLQGLKQARALFEPQLASRFNPLALFSPWENDLSRVFAELLDPQGTHGQGELFLQGFLQAFGLQQPWTARRPVEVRTEARTGQDRRIDIEIRFAPEPGQGLPGLLAIENKPWAADQPAKVAHYLDDLQARSGGRCRLIYLSGDGTGPSACSLGPRTADDPGLTVLGYPRLGAAWLRPAAQAARAPRVRAFLEDLAHYIDTEFNAEMNMNESEWIADELLRSPEALAAALDIASATETLKTRLLGQLFEGLSQQVALQRPGWRVERDVLNAKDSKKRGIWVRFAAPDRVRVELTFDADHCNQCCLGLHLAPGTPGAGGTGEVDLKTLSASLLPPGRNGNDWPWYQHFEPQHWQYEALAWQRIQSGEMARRLFEQIDQIYRRFEAAGQLDALR